MDVLLKYFKCKALIIEEYSIKFFILTEKFKTESKKQHQSSPEISEKTGSGDWWFYGNDCLLGVCCELEYTHQ